MNYASAALAVGAVAASAYLERATRSHQARADLFGFEGVGVIFVDRATRDVYVCVGPNKKRPTEIEASPVGGKIERIDALGWRFWDREWNAKRNAIREVAEETGIKIKASDLHHMHESGRGTTETKQPALWFMAEIDIGRASQQFARGEFTGLQQVTGFKRNGKGIDAVLDSATLPMRKFAAYSIEALCACIGWAVPQ